MVESSALLKRRTSKGYRGFESLPHREFNHADYACPSAGVVRAQLLFAKNGRRTLMPNHWLADEAGVADVLLTEAAGPDIVTIS